ncbi:MAG: hypothetical protein J5916_07550 [Oscillospiraceae bacterium]|nr:hypothetical protein [Oscillospiraceae bacterium]
MSPGTGCEILLDLCYISSLSRDAESVTLDFERDAFSIIDKFDMPFLCSYTKIYPGLEFSNELITIYYNKVFCLSLGDIDMKKMNSPKLEVIQFNTEDVIVTSGSSVTTGFSSLSHLDGNNYFTSGYERKQSGSDEVSGKYYYIFNVTGSALEFQTNAFPINNITKEIWAWFDESTESWYTEWKGKNYYYEGNENYNWRENNRTG